jgi:hypothetical protein
VVGVREARGELAEWRPSRAVGGSLPRRPRKLDASLAGGLRKPIEAALGIATRIPAQGVFAALCADADFLKTAMTRDQAVAIGAG